MIIIFSQSHDISSDIPIANHQGKNYFFGRESSLWDMFKVLLFWRPALRQDDHVISGLFRGAKRFFFMTGVREVLNPVGKREVCIFAFPFLRT